MSHSIFRRARVCLLQPCWDEITVRGPRAVSVSSELQRAQNNWELRKRHSKRGKKDGKSNGGARLSTVCLSMYSITENIYCSQLSSVAILLQPEPNYFTSYNTRKGLCSLSLGAIVLRSLPPTCLLVTVNEARQLFCVHRTADVSPRISRDFILRELFWMGAGAGGGGDETNAV
jgi:hypothetical protein